MSGSGCQVVAHAEGRYAMMEAPSGERFFISLGAFTLRIYRERRWFGWRWPKRIAAWRVAHIGPNSEYPAMTVELARMCIVRGAIEVFGPCESLEAVKSLSQSPEMPDPAIVGWQRLEELCANQS